MFPCCVIVYYFLAPGFTYIPSACCSSIRKVPDSTCSHTPGTCFLCLIFVHSANIYISPSLPPSPYICVSVSFSWILFPIVLRTLGTHIKIPHWNSLLLQYYKYVSCDTKSLLIIIILLSTKIKNKFLKVSYPINCRDQLIQVQLWHLQKCWFPSTALFLRKMALHLRRHVFHIIGLFLFFFNFFS